LVRCSNEGLIYRRKGGVHGPIRHIPIGLWVDKDRIVHQTIDAVAIDIQKSQVDGVDPNAGMNLTIVIVAIARSADMIYRTGALRDDRRVTITITIPVGPSWVESLVNRAITIIIGPPADFDARQDLP
jgi:hypothetical protein